MECYKNQIISSVAQAKEKLENLKSDDSLVFPMFADLHTMDIDHERTKRLLQALEIITQEIEYDAVLNLGDNFGMLGRIEHIETPELKSRFDKLFSAIHSTTNHPIINVAGNHDALGTDFFKPEFWNSLTKGKYGNTSAVYDDEGSYYYVDYEKANTRLVILCLPSDSDIESEMPTPLWKFGEKQLQWFKAVALNTSKDIILISHAPFFEEYTGDKNATLGVWTGTEAKTSYISALCGWMDDSDEAVDIMNEFISNSGKIIACLSGHMHTDSFWLPLEEQNGKKNPLPCCQIVTTSTCFTENVEPIVGISIDLVVWTASKGELNLIRIGDGEDRKVVL